MTDSAEQFNRPLQPKFRYVCAVKVEEHRTWRMFIADSVEKIETSLKKDKLKVVQKRFYEVNLLTGNMEEF